VVAEPAAWLTGRGFIKNKGHPTAGALFNLCDWKLRLYRNFFPGVQNAGSSARYWTNIQECRPITIAVAPTTNAISNRSFESLNIVLLLCTNDYMMGN